MANLFEDLHSKEYASPSKPLLMSHMTAVLSTEPDTMKFPSRVQQMSYTSSMCPLDVNYKMKRIKQ